jgi:hypothetical protein
MPEVITSPPVLQLPLRIRPASFSTALPSTHGQIGSSKIIATLNFGPSFIAAAASSDNATDQRNAKWSLRAGASAMPSVSATAVLFTSSSPHAHVVHCLKEASLAFHQQHKSVRGRIDARPPPKASAWCIYSPLVSMRVEFHSPELPGFLVQHLDEKFGRGT